MIASGKIFGNWTVLNFAEVKNNRVYYNCECSCGRKAKVRDIKLVNKLSTQCQACAGKKRVSNEVLRIEPGSNFGKWTVIAETKSSAVKRVTYLCKCECGTVKDVVASDLRTGRSSKCRSCGSK